MSELLVEGLEEEDFRILLCVLKENTSFKTTEYEKFLQLQKAIGKLEDIVSYLDNN